MILTSKYEVITGDTHMEVANELNERLGFQPDESLVQPVGPIAFRSTPDGDLWYVTVATMVPVKQPGAGLAIPR